MGDTAVAPPEIQRVVFPHPGISYEQTPIASYKNFDWKALGNNMDAVHFARASGFKETGMSVNEVALLYSCLEQMGRGYIVELGRNYGTSTRLFIQHVIRYGGSLESWDLKNWPGYLETMKENGYDHRGKSLVVGGESYDVWLREGVHSIKTPINREDRFVDFLLIDTEHGLEDALGEYMRWRQYLKSGAFVAFHDACLPAVARAIDIAKEVELHFDGRIAQEFVNERIDGFGVHVFRWKR